MRKVSHGNGDENLKKKEKRILWSRKKAFGRKWGKNWWVKQSTKKRRVEITENRKITEMIPGTRSWNKGPVQPKNHDENTPNEWMRKCMNKSTIK